LTVNHAPNSNFAGLSAMTRLIHIDADGDGLVDRRETIATPIFHFISQLQMMGTDFWAMPEFQVGGHVVSGFASRGADAIHALLYTHHNHDPQSRSNQRFEAHLKLRGINWGRAKVTQYQFDKQNNSYFEMGKALRDRKKRNLEEMSQSAAWMIHLNMLRTMPAEVVLAMLANLRAKPVFAELVVPEIQRLAKTSQNASVKSAALETLEALRHEGDLLTMAEFRAVQEKSKLQPTRIEILEADADGNLSVLVPIAANGANRIVIEPAD